MYACVVIYILSLIYVELENRCILAAFALCVGGKGSKQTNSRGAIFQSCECKSILYILCHF
jgi:hypothetical protein